MDFLNRAAIAIFFAIAFFSSSAKASGWQVGFDLGATSHHIADAHATYPSGTTPINNDHERNDYGFEFHVGYQFFKFFAAGIGYVDLGNETGTQSALVPYPFTPTGTLTGTGSHRRSVEGPTLTAISTFPFGKWEPIAKVGVIFAHTKYENEFRAFRTIAIDEKQSSHTTDPVVGLGIGYRVSDRLLVKLLGSRYLAVGDAVRTHESDTDMYSVGLLYTF